jgi:hypothetical protein
MGSQQRDPFTSWEYTQVALCQSLVEMDNREQGQKVVKCGCASETKNGRFDARRLLTEGVYSIDSQAMTCAN